MFWRKTSGIRRLQASSTKWAPFWADSAKRTPRLARIADRMALDAGEAADERVAVEGLELVEAAAVDDPRDHLERVELVPVVLGDDPVELGRVDRGRLGGRELPGRRRRGRRGGGRSGGRARVRARRRRRSGRRRRSARVERRAAELLGGHVLAGGGLHERRAADEDRAGSLDDHRLVAHRGDVGAAGGAGSHHDGDLGDVLAERRAWLKKMRPKCSRSGKTSACSGQEGPARVDEVDARAGGSARRPPGRAGASSR